MAQEWTRSNLTYHATTTDQQGYPDNWLYEVFCNGERLPDCFAADDCEGWADCRVFTASGYERDSMGKLKVVRHTGRVQILRVNVESWPLAESARLAQRAEFFADMKSELQNESR